MTETLSLSSSGGNVLKRFPFFLLLLLAGVLCAGNGAAQIRLAHALPVTHPVNLSLLHLKQRLDLQTQGRLKIDVIPESLSGSDTSLLEQVQAGILPMAVINARTLSRIAPAFSLLRMPFIFPDRRNLASFLDGSFQKKLDTGLLDNRLVVLAWFELGPRVWLSVSKQFTKPADFRDAKFNGPDGPVFMNMAATLGSVASAIPLRGEQLRDALSLGAMDVDDMLLANAVSGVTDNFEPELTLSRHVWEVAFLVASTSFWNGLNPSDQREIVDAASEAELVNQGCSIRNEVKLLREGRSRGIKLISLDDASRRAFLRALYPVLQTMSNAVGKDVFDRFMNAVQQSRPVY
jgi:TRAP-type C4-dicarboxylate transport system substrate-binding protein